MKMHGRIEKMRSRTLNSYQYKICVCIFLVSRTGFLLDLLAAAATNISEKMIVHLKLMIKRTKRIGIERRAQNRENKNSIANSAARPDKK